jgi:hypothetical protein
MLDPVFVGIPVVPLEAGAIRQHLAHRVSNLQRRRVFIKTIFDVRQVIPPNGSSVASSNRKWTIPFPLEDIISLPRASSAAGLPEQSGPDAIGYFDKKRKEFKTAARQDAKTKARQEPQIVMCWCARYRLAVQPRLYRGFSLKMARLSDATAKPWQITAHHDRGIRHFAMPHLRGGNTGPCNAGQTRCLRYAGS